MKIIDMAYGEKMANTYDFTEDNFERKGFLNMTAALNFADVEFGGDGIKANIEQWATNKKSLIDRLRKSPDWNEQILSVVKDVKFSFTRSHYDIREMRDRLLGRLERKLEEKGGDYANISALLSYNRNGSLGYPSEIFTTERIINPQEIEFVKNVLKYPRVQEGMKCSRLMQKIIAQWDENFLEDHNITEIYNQWTEYISEVQKNYKFVLSLNPADYLLMSYGDSWASCHIINPALSDRSGGYDGQFRAGTLSYMGDNVSAISYLVNKDTSIETLPFTPKIMRQVILLDPEHPRFLQSRMYPAKDGSGYYDLFANSVKSILTDVFDAEKDKCPVEQDKCPVEQDKCPVEQDNWEKKDLPNCVQDDRHHYADYHCYSNSCNYFVHEDSRMLDWNDSTFHIGADTLCIMCGDESSSDTNTLYCSHCEDDGSENCYDCGNHIDEGDIYWVNGDAYCSDCVTSCDRCNDYFPNNDMSTDVHGNQICSQCVDNHYFNCASCDELFYEDDRLISPDGDAYCESCYNDNVGTCDNCGDAFMANDLDNNCHCSDCAEELAQEAEEPEELVAAAETVEGPLTLWSACL